MQVARVWSFEGPCILTESEGIRPDLALKRMTGFVCQSLLKERRRPPTGGLREALGESLRGRVFMPSSPGVGSKTTFGASATRFPPTWEKRWILLGME